MSLWRVLYDALFGPPREAWNPDDDEDVRFLRRQAALAHAETRRLRERVAWEDLFDNGKERR